MKLKMYRDAFIQLIHLFAIQFWFEKPKSLELTVNYSNLIPNSRFVNIRINTSNLQTIKKPLQFNEEAIT